MSQMPPGGPPNYPPYVPPGMRGPAGYPLPPGERTSAAAVTSLVCGLIFCVPFVTGIVAIITGFVGISATSNPAVKGRGLAIAGLILGLLCVAGWGIGGGVGMVLVHESKPERDFAKQYVADLSAGKTDQCVQNSSNQLTPGQIDAFSKQAAGWGTLNDTTVVFFFMSNNNGVFKGVVSGTCQFSAAQHGFALTLVKEAGAYKVDTFKWQ